MIRCPHCEKEIKGERVCEHCGKALARSQTVEVRYSDFKVTELLDIKMPGQAPVRQESRETSEGSGTEGETPPNKEPAAKKNSRLVLAAVIFFLAAAAGFVLLKLFTKF